MALGLNLWLSLQLRLGLGLGLGLCLLLDWICGAALAMTLVLELSRRRGLHVYLWDELLGMGFLIHFTWCL